MRLIAGNKFPKKEWFKEKKLCWIPIFIPMINPLQKYFYELKTCWKKLDTKYDIKLLWNIYDQQYSNEQIKLRLIAGKNPQKMNYLKKLYNLVVRYGTQFETYMKCTIFHYSIVEKWVVLENWTILNPL